MTKKPFVEVNEEYSVSAKESVRKVVEPELVRNNGNTVFYTGYSGDTQQVVPQVCYNATVSSTSAEQTDIHLDTPLSFSELESKLGISVSISGKYGMFSANDRAGYLRSIQNKEDYSLSINYYVCATNNVTVQLAGYGDKALIESGKRFYNGGKNPYFGLVCGDHYITSYQQGALLIMGFTFEFRSSIAKREFVEKFGSTFGSIINTTDSVVVKDEVTGSVKIHALQIGGEPTKLSNIFNKDSTGKYYALTCSLTAINDCVKVESDMKSYARNEFPKQFSFKNNTGLTPLGIGFSQFNPIEYIGLIPPVSLVTQDVIHYRHQLSDNLKENEYYKQKLHPFFNKGYPVELDVTFINKARSVLFKANSNVNILLQVDGGAADCFNLPDDCKNIKTSIDSQLYSISVSDLKFLENIKYRITNQGGLFYNTGGGLETSWFGVPDKSRNSTLVNVHYVSVSDKKYSYDIDILYPGDLKLYELSYTGNLVDGSMEYVGKLCSSGNCQAGVREKKEISPFFFQAYNTTECFSELSC